MVHFRAVGALGALALVPVVAGVLALVTLAAALVAAARGSWAFATVWGALAVLVAAALVTCLRSALRSRQEPTPGPQLPRGAHPRLWAEIDAVARIVGSDVPDRVVLTPDVNAAVRQTTEGRELLVGLPLLAAFNVGELRSVLAHELAHFAGGEVALSARTARAWHFVGDLTDRSDPLERPLLAAYQRFASVVAYPAAQDAEQAADLASLRVTGSDDSQSALRMMIALDLAWAALESDYLALFARSGARASLTHGLRQMVVANSASVAALADDLISEETATWRSTHPTVRQRLVSLQAAGRHTPSIDVGPAQADALAATLLTGGDTWLTDAEGDLLSRPLPLTSWAQVLDRSIGREVMDDGMEAACRITGHTPSEPPTLDEVLEAVSAQAPIGAWFMPGGTAQEIQVASHRVLQSIVVTALLATKHVRVSESWDGPWHLVDRDELPVDVSDVCGRALASGQGMRELRTWLIMHRVHLARPLRLPE